MKNKITSKRRAVLIESIKNTIKGNAQNVQEEKENSSSSIVAPHIFSFSDKINKMKLSSFLV